MCTTHTTAMNIEQNCAPQVDFDKAIEFEKNHSKECLELITNNIKIETNLIGTYKDYINRCFKY